MEMGTGTSMRTEINITPLIDVLLVLIIIFILLMNRLVITAQIPRDDTSATRSEIIEHIVLELRDDGSYAINTQPVAQAQLPAKLREIFAVRQDKTLFIKSGSERVFGETIAMMDEAKGAGVEVVALIP